MKTSVKNLARQQRRISVWPHCIFLSLFFISALLRAQTSSSDKPVPILTGSAGYFTFVTAGQTQLNAQINPVLLLPLGDHWLVESRAEFEGEFQRPPDGGAYGGPVSKNLDYAQLDYIANPYVTVTVGMDTVGSGWRAGTAVPQGAASELPNLPFFHLPVFLKLLRNPL